MARRNLIRSHRRLIKEPRFAIRAQKFGRPSTPGLPPVVKLKDLNKDESRIAIALRELGIRFRTQVSVFGGNILGGAKTDFELVDFNIVIEYNGPFHDVSQNVARDALRNIGVTARGKRIVTLHKRDLRNIKRSIIDKIGRPI